MPTIFNTPNLPLEIEDDSPPQFTWHTSPRLAKLANSKHLHIDMRSLDPGKFSFPYHFHRVSEEFFYIIAGQATLRTPEGFQKVKPGDLVFFEQGPESAHQLYNHGDEPCVYLDVRTMFGVDVVEYPDSGKVNISPYSQMFFTADQQDYYAGEENVAAHWPKEILAR